MKKIDMRKVRLLKRLPLHLVLLITHAQSHVRNAKTSFLKASRQVSRKKRSVAKPTTTVAYNTTLTRTYGISLTKLILHIGKHVYNHLRDKL